MASKYFFTLEWVWGRELSWKNSIKIVQKNDSLFTFFLNNRPSDKFQYINYDIWSYVIWGPSLISSSTKAIFWGVASVIWQPDRKKSFRSIFAIFKTTNLFDYCVIRINITTLSFNSMAMDYSCIIPNLKHTNIELLNVALSIFKKIQKTCFC